MSPRKAGVHSRGSVEEVVCNSMLPLLSAVLVTMRLPVPLLPGSASRGREVFDDHGAVGFHVEVFVDDDRLVEVELLVFDGRIRAARAVHGGYVDEVRVSGDDDVAPVRVHDAKAQRTEEGGLEVMWVLRGGQLRRDGSVGQQDFQRPPAVFMASATEVRSSVSVEPSAKAMEPEARQTG